MAMARDLAGGKEHVLAVIGDGSLTAGEAFEGLNLAGHMGRRLIVVLNDNEISISPDVGALSLFLSRTLSRRWVRQTRKDVLQLLRSIPRIGQKLALYAMRGEWSFKSLFSRPACCLEAFRFTYIGPVDGHDRPALCRHLQMAAAVEDGPVLLHVRTCKGKGYAPAEKDPTHFHGVGHFEPETGLLIPSSNKTPSFTGIFGKTLVELAEKDDRLLAITAAMPEGTGTNLFEERFPERFVDVGICEQHAVTFAAGLAASGFHPVVAIYSTFLQRAYDQIVHDVCLQKLPVTFCVDRAGLVGEDGATHHGVFDIAYLRHIPEMTLLAPRDENMLRHCLLTATTAGGPCAVRYPRGAGMGVPLDAELRLLPSAQGEIMQEGERVALSWPWATRCAPGSGSRGSHRKRVRLPAAGLRSHLAQAAACGAAGRDRPGTLRDPYRLCGRRLPGRRFCLGQCRSAGPMTACCAASASAVWVSAMPSWNTVPRPSCASWWACGHRISSGLCGNRILKD